MKKINWRLRVKNRATFISMIVTGIGLIYQILGSVGVVPKISEDLSVQIAGYVINFLAFAGIIVDPTTEGVGDSDIALKYVEPRKSGHKE